MPPSARQARTALRYRSARTSRGWARPGPGVSATTGGPGSSGTKHVDGVRLAASMLAQSLQERRAQRPGQVVEQPDGHPFRISVDEDNRVGGKPDHPRIPARRRRHDRHTAVGRREPAHGHVIQHRGKRPIPPLVIHAPILRQECRPARARVAISWECRARSRNTCRQESRICASPGAWRETASQCCVQPSGTSMARRDRRSQRLPSHRTEPILAGRARAVSSSRRILTGEEGGTGKERWPCRRG